METQTKQETPLKRKIRDFEGKNMSNFKPSRTFYKSVNIGQKRFGQLVRGETSLMVNELRSLSNYFDCSIMDLIN